MLRLQPSTFLSRGGTLVDVRSPGEFEEGHIPGAINIPLFTNEERARVGTCYKQQGKDKAISLGLEIVGPKLSQLATSAKAVDHSELRVYCWRGGMRSAKMAELFQLGGKNCTVLEGGYKAYRNELLTAFEKLETLIVLQGATGAGKTEILHKLAEIGEQVIDLEGQAHHRGSAFGGIGMPAQPTTQQFQNNCFSKLASFDTSRRVWVEGESKTIGRVYLPETLWDRMNTASLIEIDVPLEARIQNLVKDYGQLDKEALKTAIEKISRKLGGQNVQAAMEDLEAGRRAELAVKLLHYYDKSYQFSRARYKTRKPKVVTSTTNDAIQNARAVLTAVAEPALKQT